MLIAMISHSFLLSELLYRIILQPLEDEAAHMVRVV